MANNKWLLLATFCGQDGEFKVVAKGRELCRMVPLSTVIGRSRYMPDVRALVARVARSGQPCRAWSHDGQRQVLGYPLADASGHVNGVFTWTGERHETPPARDPAGAWTFNLTTGWATASQDLLDMYRVPPGRRRTRMRTADAFRRLVSGADEAAALALIVRARPGEQYQARWAARMDSGEVRSIGLACLTVRETRGGRALLVTRGICHDTGQVSPAPGPERLQIDRQVIEAERRPGTARVIVNPRNLMLIRWIDDPLPGIRWRAPAVHPGDREAITRMMAQFLATGRAEGTLRLRSANGGWTPLLCTCNRMRLDTETTAALVTLSALT